MWESRRSLCASSDPRKIRNFCTSSADLKSKSTHLVPAEAVVTISFIHSRRFLICSQTMRGKLGLAAWARRWAVLNTIEPSGSSAWSMFTDSWRWSVLQNNGHCVPFYCGFLKSSSKIDSSLRGLTKNLFLRAAEIFHLGLCLMQHKLATSHFWIKISHSWINTFHQ